MLFRMTSAMNGDNFGRKRSNGGLPVREKES